MILVNLPASSQEHAPLSSPEVVPAVAQSQPPKPALRRSERQWRSPKRYSDFVLTKVVNCSEDF